MKKKVLHVVNVSFVLPYFIGDQFDYFSNRGIEFYVACSPSKHFFDYAVRKNIHPIEVNILREINIIADIKAVITIYKVLKKNKIDTIIGHTPKGGLIAMLAAFLAKKEHRIYFRHGIMFETSVGFKRFILKILEQLAGLLATKVICVSPSVLKISNENKLSSSNKNLLLGKGTCNGIDLFRFKKQTDLQSVLQLSKKLNIKDELIVGYVGRLVKDKGIIELIAAWKKLLTEYSNIKLLLVGPFEERDGLPHNIIEFIHSESSIIYTGLTDDTVPFYQIMDLFILPSYREGFPTVVLEASAMELPVITTTYTGCIDSIIENVSGIFTEINKEDIYNKISFYINNPKLRKEHGVNGRKFVCDNFQQENIWSEIEKKILNR